MDISRHHHIAVVLCLSTKLVTHQCVEKSQFKVKESYLKAAVCFKDVE